MTCEQSNILFVKHMCKRVGSGLEVVKSSLFGFLNPCFVVAVAVEYDSLVLLDGILDEVVERCLEVLGIFKNVCKLLQLFRNGCVENCICA